MALADGPEAEASVDEEDRWAIYRLLTGTWEVQMDARLGQGSAQRKYELIFDDLCSSASMHLSDCRKS